MMAMAAVMLWSCQEKEGLEGAVSGKVELAGSVTDGQILAGPDGGEFQVNVTSSADWRVSGLADWVTPSAEAGKSGQALTFTILPNDGVKSRTAVFKVFCADAVQAVTIIQSPTYVATLVSEDTVTLNSDANQIAVKMISNIEELEIDFGGAEEWVKLNEVADAFGKKIILFDVLRSQDFKSRSAVLTLGGAGVNEPVTVTVNQAQRDTAFVVGEQRIIKDLQAISIDLVIKSNVDVTFSVPSWMTRTDGDLEIDENGLKSQKVNLSAEASGGSRSANISFKSGSKVIGSVFIKQQNPNPVFATIPDANLRYLLESQGMIIDEGGQCELLASALSATSLQIGTTNPDSYSSDPIESIEGLETFPNLESLTLGSITVKKINVGEYPKLNELKLINLCDVEEINTGSRPIKDVSNLAGLYTYTGVKQIVIKGENIENIDFSAGGYYMWYEAIESFDVTECPKLATLNVYRYDTYYGDESSLKYVYMTAAQTESVTVNKRPKVEIVVK